MSYRTIVAVLDSEHNAAPVTEFAMEIARQFSAHVIGLRAETLATIPLIAPMEIPDPTAIETLQRAVQDETRKIESAFRLHAEPHGIPYEFRSYISTSGASSEAVLEIARSCDLIVARHNDGKLETDNSSDIETFILESGRPVLLLPHAAHRPLPVRRALVAWNGSREAARAAFDALPFLKQAENVEIFSVDPPDMPRQNPDFAGADLAAALARHGVKVSIRTEENCPTSPAEAITARLSDESVDLLVMGGYGHSRWWEMLFGGVTRSLLGSMTAFTLLSR